MSDKSYFELVFMLFICLCLLLILVINPCVASLSEGGWGNSMIQTVTVNNKIQNEYANNYIDGNLA